MTTPSDLQLQLALAKLLPELIEIAAQYTYENGKVYGRTYIWKPAAKPQHVGLSVTPREWDWIMREVEKKLREHAGDWHNYGVTLGLEVLREETTSFEENVTDPRLNGFGMAELATLSWQTRAIALLKTLNIPVS